MISIPVTSLIARLSFDPAIVKFQSEIRQDSIQPRKDIRIMILGDRLNEENRLEEINLREIQREENM